MYSLKTLYKFWSAGCQLLEREMSEEVIKGRELWIKLGLRIAQTQFLLFALFYFEGNFNIHTVS